MTIRELAEAAAMIDAEYSDRPVYVRVGHRYVEVEGIDPAGVDAAGHEMADPNAVLVLKGE